LLDQAVKLAPDFAPAHWQRGDMHREGRWVTLQEYFEAEKTSTNNVQADYDRQRNEYLRSVEPIVLNDAPGAAPGAIPEAAAPAYVKVAPTTTRYLRKTFDLADKPHEALIHIVAVGNCEVFVNGHHILQAHNRRMSGTEKITSRLHAGRNVVAIALGAVNLQQVPGLYARVEGILHNKQIFAAPSDFTWKVATAEQEGWKEAAFDDADWEAVVPSRVPLPEDRGPILPDMSADLELALARWCHSNGLEEQARFHWMRLLQVKPASPDAIKGLGLVVYGDKLLTREQLEAEKKLEHAANAALARWEPALRKLKADLESGIPRRAEAALTKMRSADVSAIGAFETVLADSGNVAGDASFAVHFVKESLSRIPDHEATEALVRLALKNEAETVRDAAIHALRPRDQIAFVPRLMAMLEEPVTVTTTLTKESDRVAVCRAEYFRKGIEFDEARTETYRYESNSDKKAKDRDKDNQTVDPHQAAVGRARAIADAVAAQNQRIEAANERILAILKPVTGEDRGLAASDWWSWWRGHNELHVSANPVRRSFNEYVTYLEQRTRAREKDCFAKGTPVWTTTGLRAIETIRVGDAVLAQDVDSGELAFKVVLATSLRPPGPMLAVRVGDEPLVSTRGHRYWVAGTGWRMAKELKAKDRLHSCRESLELDGVDPAPEQPAYNLVVDGFSTFFVGRLGILVNDTGAPRPTTALVPGLKR